MELIIGQASVLDFKARGRGRSRAISISNTRKITANKKNRIENGSRALFFGSKPHSNGEDFSRSRMERDDRKKVMEMRMMTRIKAIVMLRDWRSIGSIA